MPAGDGITFSYGDYSFDPRPLFTINKEVIKTSANTGLTTKYSMSLNGTILPTGINLDDFKGGLNTVISGTHALETAFAKDFEVLLLKCEGTDPIISGYPKVISVDVNNASDNYVRRADYTINLELVSLTGSRSNAVGMADGGGDLSASGLISLTDDINIEFLDERVGGEALSLFGGTLPTVFNISRSMSAQGDSLPATGGEAYIEPWARAKSYIVSKLADTGNYSDYFSDAMCIDGMNVTNTFRTISISKSDGSCSATQTSVAFTGNYNAIEDFEAAVEQSSDSAITNVSINGTIQGFTNIDYGTCPPTGAAFNNAYLKWTEEVSGLIKTRAEAAYDTSIHTPIRTPDDLHIIPLNKSITYNTLGGIISYNCSYDNRVDYLQTGAITENITYTDSPRVDIYASLTILGRVAGPLLQDLGTKGSYTTEISIDAVFKPQQASTSFQFGPAGNDLAEYTTLMTSLDNEFVTNDSRTWNPAAGHFTWTKSWELGKCT